MSKEIIVWVNCWICSFVTKTSILEYATIRYLLNHSLHLKNYLQLFLNPFRFLNHLGTHYREKISLWMIFFTHLFFKFIWYAKTHTYTQIFCPLVHSTNACYSSWDWANPKEPGTQGLPHEWQRFNYLSYHLLPPIVHVSRKLEWREDLWLKPRHSEMECRYSNGQLNHCAKCSPN